MMETIVERNHRYHNDFSAQASGMIRIYGEDEVEYYKTFITKEIPVRKAGPAAALGSAIHALTLEGSYFEDLIAIEPDGEKRTKEAKAAYARFLTENTGKDIITVEQFHIALKVYGEIMKHAPSAVLVDKGEPERIVYWMDDSGLRCRAKIDIHIPDESEVVDLKTTTRPVTVKHFLEHVRQWNLYDQAAHYLTAVKALKYKWIVAQTVPPWRVAVFVANPKRLEYALERRAATLRAMYYRITNNDWTFDEHEIQLPE